MELMPIVDQVTDGMVQYSKDQGAVLLKAGATQAVEALKRMFVKVLDRVRKKDPRTAEKFAENPEGYQAPLKDLLQEEAAADPDFLAELKALLEEVKAESKAAGISYEGTVSGSGALSQGEGATSAGAGGIAVGGNAGGIRQVNKGKSGE